MRGKHYLFILFYRDPGITPAGAGKTLSSITIMRGNKDHPRRCGENANALDNTKFPAGSPPQVRGKLDQICCKRVAQRITPAGAGKTTELSGILTFSKDHPRRCGENLAPSPNSKIQLGSPPQVRGKRPL